ncbi:MAG: hypothetical protein CVU43_24035 [Chloroflexi bacterium HGW-Chloroflexi-5]|nr:MAG: hypothetical protein CVU43_24035 [Chloroflexi bacterium HGW-Chloroflexi-5]
MAKNRGTRKMLVHNFYLVNKEFLEKNTDNISPKALNKEKSVSVEDDIILFIWETMKWIQTQNYAHKKMWGLNYDGMTIIPFEEIQVLKHLIKTWIVMFSFAPSLLTISKTKEGIRKEVLNEELNAFVALLDEALNTNSLIVHIGI